jgi:hypothetical protein
MRTGKRYPKELRCQDDPMEQSLLFIQRHNTLKLNPLLPRHIEKFVSN